MMIPSVIGMGKLGASMIAAFASRGHTVWGIDKLPSVNDAVRQGRAPV